MNSQVNTITWKVSVTESGSTLLAFLQKVTTSYSARHLKRILERNRCLVNHRTERFASYRVGTGDQVTLLEETVSTRPLSSGTCLFEDEHLLIYDKPPGMPSDSPQLLNALKGSLPFLALAHRLDRDTSGVLLLAKSPHALARLETLFQKRVVNKCYLAIADGIPSQSKGLIDNYLGCKHRYQGQGIWGEVSSKQGVRAITEWSCESRGKQSALLSCRPKTGRTHQLRVHLSSMKHPILGDFQYGRVFSCPYRPSRHLLHASSLSFPHPITEDLIQVTAPLPYDFQEALHTLGINPVSS